MGVTRAKVWKSDAGWTFCLTEGARQGFPTPCENWLTAMSWANYCVLRARHEKAQYGR